MTNRKKPDNSPLYFISTPNKIKQYSDDKHKSACLRVKEKISEKLRKNYEKNCELGGTLGLDQFSIIG